MNFFLESGILSRTLKTALLLGKQKWPTYLRTSILFRANIFFQKFKKDLFVSVTKYGHNRFASCLFTRKAEHFGESSKRPLRLMNFSDAWDRT